MSELDETASELDDSASEEELCSELDDSTVELERTVSDEEEISTILDELDSIELDDSITDEEDSKTLLDEVSLELENSRMLLDESAAIEELEIAEELDDCDELEEDEELEGIDELEDCEELDQVDELDDIDDEDLTVISTSKVIYSLSEDSLMLVSEIFMSSPFQKTNLLNEVTFLEPGNGSDGAALVPVVVTASSISTYMWLPSTLIFRLLQTETT